MASEQEIIAAHAVEIERLRSKVASLEDQLYWLRKKMFGKMSEKNLLLDPAVLSEPILFDDPLTEEERTELEAAVRKDEEDAAKLIQVRRFELAPLLVMPLPKCMASESLLTGIILQKFFYHMPFYRVIQKFKELGVKIYDSTMNDWYVATCEKLKALYDILKREVLSRDYIQVDESTLPVIGNENHCAVKAICVVYACRDGEVGGFPLRYGFPSPRDCAKTSSRLPRNDLDGWLWRLRSVRE